MECSEQRRVHRKSWTISVLTITARSAPHRVASEKSLHTFAVCLEEARGQTLVEKKDQEARSGNTCRPPCLRSYPSGWCLWANLFSFWAFNPSSVKGGWPALASAVKIKGHVNEREGFRICWYLGPWCDLPSAGCSLTYSRKYWPNKTCSCPQRACHLMEEPDGHLIPKKAAQGAKGTGGAGISRRGSLREVTLGLGLKGWKTSRWV